MLDAARQAILSPSTRVVSFDVFDTLLVRPVIEPTDLFHIMERRICAATGQRRFPFADIRPMMEAEARALSRVRNPDHQDITLDEILDVLRSVLRLDEAELSLIRQIELEVERAYLQPRRAIADLYDLARAAGKTVIAVSDNYLPGAFLGEVLKGCGFDVATLYVSGDLRKSKGRGGLYPLILRDQRVKPAEIVHIGDNAWADYHQPRKFGIRAVHVPKPVDTFIVEQAAFAPWDGHALDRAEPGFRMLLGSVVNDVFDTPARKAPPGPSLFNGDPYILGYYALGPLLLMLTHWVMARAIRESCDMVAFIARDGHLMHKVYERLADVFPEAPPAEYVRCSRSTCFFLEVESPADFLTNHRALHIDRSMTAGDILRQRLRITPSDALAAHLREAGFRLDAPPGSFDAFFRCCLDHADEVLSGIRHQRDLARRYYAGIFAGKSRVALFDVGYSGRAQRALSAGLDADLLGYYLFNFERILDLDRLGLRHETYLSSPTNRWVKDIELSTGLLETLISEFDTGSIIGFAEDGEGVAPLLQPSDLSAGTGQTLGAIQAGALDFCTVSIARFGRDLDHLAISPGTAAHVLGRFMNAPLAEDARLFEGMAFSNGITGQETAMIGKSEDTSHWKEGFLALRGRPGRTPGTPPRTSQGHARAPYGVLGWRRLYTPVVRHYVGKLGNAQDLRLFDRNPKTFFEGLTSPKYRRIGRVLYP